MGIVATLKSLTRPQRNAFAASFLGWMLDAFDYFILVFVILDVSKQFHAQPKTVEEALFLTLAMRPVGAFLFGMIADRIGRRIPLMIDIACYSMIELLTGFAPSLTAFLVLRAIFGIAMGGEWGLGASLAMESVPAATRGVLSGLLQEGYACGYLLAAVVFQLVEPHLGWRWMFFIGVAPALVILYIRRHVPESPAWQEQKLAQLPPSRRDLGKHLGLFVYMALLMAAFNFMSHGTQDNYPTFLKAQLHFDARTVSWIAIVYNIGALFGGITFGTLSQRIGRRRAIVIAALLALPCVPLWAFTHSPVALAASAFALQFFVQGAWGVIPAHLNELSPRDLRGTFPGFAYQCGNLLASRISPFQAGLAASWGGNYARALATTCAVILVAVAVVTGVGREAKNVEMG